MNNGFISQMSEKASIARIFKGIVRVIIWVWHTLPMSAAYKLIIKPIKAVFVCWLMDGSMGAQSTDENPFWNTWSAWREMPTFVMWASSISSWDSVTLGSGRTVTAMTLELTTVWFLQEES